VFRNVIRSSVLVLFTIVFLAGCDNFGLIDQFSIASTGPLAVSPTARAIAAGQTINFVASGGTSPYVFASLLENTNGTAYIDPNTGTYTASTTEGSDTVTVKDATGATVQAEVTIVKLSPLQIIPSNVTISEGNEYIFSAYGGSGEYQYSLNSGDVGDLFDDGTHGTYVAPNPIATSPTEVTVILSDTAGSTKSQATVTIVSGGALTLTPLNPSVTENGSITFVGSGGTPPYTFSASSGTGGIDPNTGVFLAGTAVGPQAADVTITDGATPANSVAAQVDILPAAPSNLSVTYTPNNMKLTWQNNTSATVNIAIERKQGSGGTWTALPVSLGSSTTSYVDVVSPNKDLYIYRVYAVFNDPGTGTDLNSPYSNEVFELASP